MSTDAGGGDSKTERLSSRQTDAKYVGREEHIFELLRGLADIYNDHGEVAAMNHKKRGRPFKYPHSLIAAVAVLRDRLGLSFRGCEGMCKAFLAGKDAPDFTTLCRRINGMDVSIAESLGEDVTCEDVELEMIPDGTGLTPSARGEYVRVVHKLKRGFVRLTIMINRETLEIISFEVTSDSVGETTIFEDLLKNALINVGIDPEERRAAVLAQKNNPVKTYRRLSLKADGMYDKREIFSACEKLDITPVIRVRKDANARADGVDRARSKAVLEQLGGGATPAELASLGEREREENRKKWKTRVRYGMRWLVEIVISALKRTYGDFVTARDFIRQEIKRKIHDYNTMLKVGREAAMAA